MPKVDQGKRTLLIASISAISMLGARAALGQPFASFDKTLAYLNSPFSMRLLYNHFNMIWTISTNVHILQQTGGFSDPASDGDIEMPPGTESGDIWPLLGRMTDADRDVKGERARIQSSLASAADPLSNDTRFSEFVQLVENLKGAIEEAGIPTDGELVREAIESLSHVERIAAVSVGSDGESPYLCRVFPFRIFC